MKPSAFLIDISWEGIVDHQAVAQSLRDGKLVGGALDLCGTDPIEILSSRRLTLKRKFVSFPMRLDFLNPRYCRKIFWYSFLFSAKPF